jgi:hypothetical protein
VDFLTIQIVEIGGPANGGGQVDIALGLLALIWLVKLLYLIVKALELIVRHGLIRLFLTDTRSVNANNRGLIKYLLLAECQLLNILQLLASIIIFQIILRREKEINILIVLLLHLQVRAPLEELAHYAFVLVARGLVAGIVVFRGNGRRLFT